MNQDQRTWITMYLYNNPQATLHEACEAWHTGLVPVFKDLSPKLTWVKDYRDKHKCTIRAAFDVYHYMFRESA